jgi:hypothetical protein
MSNTFPFNDATSPDPVTVGNDGLLARLAARRRVPKIFFTNSSTEYWRGDASLIHTDAAGAKDVPLSAAVRLYHFAGTQHSAGVLPLTDTNPVDGARGQQALNSLDYNPLLRAALIRMDEWVNGEKDPPPSRYPRLADCAAVAPNQLRVCSRPFRAPVFRRACRRWYVSTLVRIPTAEWQRFCRRWRASLIRISLAVDPDGNEVTVWPCRWRPTQAGTCAIRKWGPPTG